MAKRNLGLTYLLIAGGGAIAAPILPAAIAGVVWYAALTSFVISMFFYRKVAKEKEKTRQSQPQPPANAVIDAAPAVPASDDSPHPPLREVK